MNVIETFQELTCDICGEIVRIDSKKEPHGWYRCHEMVNGEGSDNPLYMWGGIPMLPTRHICPACAKKLFGEEEQ